LTAAGAGVGIAALASTSAKAFFIAPALFAGLLAGGVFGGAVLSNAANNANTGNVRTVVAAPGPAVTVGSTTCRFTNAWVGGVVRRVQVCDTY
jgi:hypothetical protein